MTKPFFIPKSKSSILRNVYLVDLFCGGGGTSTGAEFAGVKVVACVNHDEVAIAAHEANHPSCKHFREDIRSINSVYQCALVVDEIRRRDPRALIILWASLECTNFSNAAGGKPRNADSRSLAEYMRFYTEALKPELFIIENVREFLAWGPLDKNGRPESRTAGKDFLKWRKRMLAEGFGATEHRILNSADYGSCQARKRLFLQMSSVGIWWPQQTHTAKPGKDLFGTGLKKYRAVREVLDLEDRGKSIFTRKKYLVVASHKRILLGLEKFAGEDVFSQSYYGNGGVHSVADSCPTLTTKDRFALVFSISYYGRNNAYSVAEPCGTVTTNNRHALVFMDMQHGNGRPCSVAGPVPAMTTVPKYNVVSAEFIVNPQYSSKGCSLDKPSPTLIARMDKSPLSLACVEKEGEVHRFPLTVKKVAEQSSPYAFPFNENVLVMLKINIHMSKFGLSDIRIRMLNIVELKQIQGFPKDYVLLGTEAQQKKCIGNAVDVFQAKALMGEIQEKVRGGICLTN